MPSDVEVFFRYIDKMFEIGACPLGQRGYHFSNWLDRQYLASWLESSVLFWRSKVKIEASRVIIDSMT